MQAGHKTILHTAIVNILLHRATVNIIHCYIVSTINILLHVNNLLHSATVNILFHFVYRYIQQEPGKSREMKLILSVVTFQKAVTNQLNYLWSLLIWILELQNTCLAFPMTRSSLG